MNFAELLEALRGDDPPETIYDDLQAAYQGVVDGAAAKEVDHEAAIAALNDEIGRLKAQNFDLLMAASAQPAAEEEPEPEPESDLDGETDAPADRDDMFTYERTK